MSRLRIATRGSRLARWQADEVARLLRHAYPSLGVEIQVVRTTGDRVQDVPLARIGERGLFTKEVDEVLLAGEGDVAVHSLKDLPTRLPAELRLAAVTARADPRDVLLCRAGVPDSLDSLPGGARVGTSSVRRRAQLLGHRPDLVVVDLRGNLDTRIEKLDRGGYDAVVLAAAGVVRLGWQSRISSYLDPPGWLPAVGQGALAIVVRANAAEASALVARLNHPETEACVAAERAFLRTVEGGCQVPVAALATAEDRRLTLETLVASMDGSVQLRLRQEGSMELPRELGERSAAELLRRGADRILAEIRRSDAELVPGVAAP